MQTDDATLLESLNPHSPELTRPEEVSSGSARTLGSLRAPSALRAVGQGSQTGSEQDQRRRLWNRYRVVEHDFVNAVVPDYRRRERQ
jgi:hypothetical protein